MFGEVTEGLEVIDAIADVATDRYDRPYEDVTIITINRIGLPVQEPAAEADTTSTSSDSTSVE